MRVKKRLIVTSDRGDLRLAAIRAMMFYMR